MIPCRPDCVVSQARTARTAAMMDRQGRARFLTLAICWARSCCRFSWRSTGVILPGLEMRDPGGPPGLLDHGNLSGADRRSDARAEDGLADRQPQPAAHPVGDSGRGGVPGDQGGENADVAANPDCAVAGGVVPEVPD